MDAAGPWSVPMRRTVWTSLLAVCAVVVTAMPVAAQPVSLQSLLGEMIDRDRIAKLPLPEYTCKQFSSYDRESTGVDKADTWFANGDAGKFIRVEKNDKFEGGEEFVMMEAEGPGAIVRFWSANPTGTVRFYIDGSSEPALTAPLADLLGGKWRVGAPLSETVSRGWNLYLPIPYAKSIRVTQEGKRIKDGDKEYNECYRTYYQINYRTYPAGTPVESFSMAAFDGAKARMDQVQEALQTPESEARIESPMTKNPLLLNPGESKSVDLPPGPGAIRYLAMGIQVPDQTDSARTAGLRGVVMSMEFDGEETVWCPLSDFFGSGVGHNLYRSWYTSMLPAKYLHARFIMPYKQAGKVTLTNYTSKPQTVQLNIATKAYPKWDDRYMKFHCHWHYEYPIKAEGGRGTKDWNFVEVKGKGVFIGDALSVMNPVNAWWGEGDEKIYVDGEKFPSHFGTGTEDYYGYAWCCPEVFTSAFHAQPRCDGQQDGNNRGYTTVMRSRALDAIPFKESFRFDMEVWHWKACDVAYGATTWFYAMPGAVVNREKQVDAVKAGVVAVPPPPPPFKIAGAIECESMKVAEKGDGFTASEQGGFAAGLWSGEKQLFVQAKKIGDFVLLEIPAPDNAPVKVQVYATRSWDYGVVRFSVGGAQAGADTDFFNARDHAVEATGPIDLGTVTPKDGKILLRAEVVGSNPKAEGSKTYFGLDCVVLTPAR
jgi:hypothetical protein